MSEDDEPSACSSNLLDVNSEDCRSFFHIQPDSLSKGYEVPLPEGYYEQHDLVIKSRRKRFQNGYKSVYFRRYFEIKKRLDERRLCQAVSMNDTESVVHLLQRGVSPACFDSQHRSPLHLAACKGYAHLVKMLLDHGADPNARDMIGNTALHLAACTNHIDVVTLLLNAGTDACSVDRLGRSPLQLAQSKLRVLGRSSRDCLKLKEQVSQVTEMLMMFYKEGERGDSLARMHSSLREDRSSDHQLRQLLSDLTSLCIDSNDAFP